MKKLIIISALFVMTGIRAFKEYRCICKNPPIPAITSQPFKVGPCSAPQYTNTSYGACRGYENATRPPDHLVSDCKFVIVDSSEPYLSPCV